jgi:chromosomal replication initiator protein
MESESAQEIWDAALGELQIQVSKPNYRTWLEKTAGWNYQNNEFVVSVPNIFVAEYLDRNQRSLIEKTLINLTSAPDIKVTFHIDGKYKNTLRSGSLQWDKGPIRFKPDYIFDSFVLGNCNRLAYAAAQGIVQNPGYNYNPLYIYGGPGLGKTHLLHAIGHLAQARHIQVICVSAEQFTNEFVKAVRERTIDEFHNKYRNTGMLLIDDIHFISGKKQTAESFYHTFNALHNANRQIVLTSDLPPKAILLLDKRLRSRFEWGLIVKLQLPDFETRLAILQARARQREVNLNIDVLEFIAQQAQQNVRELEGALNRVVAFAKLLNTSPTVELATKALEDISSKEPSNVASTLVLDTVAGCFQLDPADLKSSKRDKETSFARRVAMYLLRQETNYSLAQIGQELGGRDPAAVTNACKRITSDISGNHQISHKIRDIQKRINPHSKQRR